MSKTKSTESMKENFIESLKYPVPNSANNVLYTLGGTTLSAFAIMAFTGVILLFFYEPNTATANQSVSYISSKIFLNYIRGLHWWTAQIIPLLIFLHIFRVVYTRSYIGIRQLNWYIGLGLFVLTLLFIFTGSILKWDQAGYEALVHSDNLAKSSGLFGRFLSSSAEGYSPLLTRIYFLHINIIPMVFLLLLSIHIIFIKLNGISPLPGKEEVWKEESTSNFLDHMKKVFFYGFIFFISMSLIAIIFPTSSSPAPISGIEVTRPPWIFLIWYPFENVFGLIALIIFPTIITLLFFIIPIIDRNKEEAHNNIKHKIAIGIVIFIFVFILVANIISYISNPAEHL